MAPGPSVIRPLLRTLCLAALAVVVPIAGGCGGGSPASADPPAPAPGDAEAVNAAADPGAPGAAEGQADPGPLTFGFRIPEEIEATGYTRAQARRLPAAELGYTLRYTGPDRPGIDIYVYPVVPDGEALAADDLPAHLESELEAALRDVRVFTDRDGIAVDDGTGVRTLEVSAGEGSVSILHRELMFSGGDQPERNSHLLVGIAGRAYLKFRTTFPSDRASELEPHVDAFVDGFVRAIETGGHVGMADYDHRAAILLPVPPDLPERFDFRVPNRLPSGWQAQGLQRLPDGGLMAVFRLVTSPVAEGAQVFLRPVPEDQVGDPGALEAHWPGELENWTTGLATSLANQGLHPEGDPEPWVPMDEVETHYGFSPVLGVRRAFSNEDGNRLEAFLAVTRIEDAFVVLSTFSPVFADDAGAISFRAFVEEFTANVLVGRPPPG